MKHRSLARLTPYLGIDERICLYFSPCLKPIILELTILFMLTSFITLCCFWSAWTFFIIFWIGLGLVAVFYLIHYWTTEYFVTEKALYWKHFCGITRVGFLPRDKVIELNVEQSPIANIFSKSGTLRAACVVRDDWVWQHVSDPAAKRQQILQIWQAE